MFSLSYMLTSLADSFIVHDDIPLWPMWQKYFEGCPAGSYTVNIHQQDSRHSNLNATIIIHRDINRVGGGFVARLSARNS